MSFEEAFKYVHPDDKDKIKKAIRDAYEENIPYEEKLRLIKSDGGIKHLHAQAEVLIDDSGNPEKLLGVVQDVTEREKNEQVLHAINELTTSLLGKTSIREVAWEIAKNTIKQLGYEDCVIYVLDKERDVLIQAAAYGPKNPYGKKIKDPIEIKVGEGIVGAAASNGEVELVQNTLDDPRYIVDDEVRKSELAVPIITDNEVVGVIDTEHPEENFYTRDHVRALKTIANLVGVKVKNAIDMQKRNEAEQALKESRQRFQSLFEQNPNAVYSFDTEGNLVAVNDALKDLTGYCIEELMEMDFQLLTYLEDREKVWNYFQKAVAGEAQTYQSRFVHKDGRIFYAMITNIPIYVNDEIIGVFGIAQDITEQKKMEKQIKASERKWQHLVEDNPQPVQVMVNGEIVFINEAGAKLYGANVKEEIMGQSILDFTCREDEVAILERKERLDKGRSVEHFFEHKVTRLDGETRYVEMNCIPIEYQGEKAIQTVLHDITDRKEKEMIIEQSLEEKKVLLQEIHHRVKNNLAVVSGLLQLQTMQTGNKELQNILHQSKLRIHSMAMIHEMLYQSESFSGIGFDQYIKELVENIDNTYSDGQKNIGIEYQMEAVSLSINKAIPCALILNELVVNCYKHAFKNRQAGNIKIALRRDADLLNLTVSDNGNGLPGDFSLEESQSLGVTLIQTLADQLEAEVIHTSNGDREGTKFEIAFEYEGAAPSLEI